MNTSPYLSVIIPAYNESANFSRGSLSSVLDYLTSQSYTWDLLLVNDGSTDNTLSLLTKFAQTDSHIRVVDNPHQGKGATVMSGAMAAAGQLILFSDMDQATPISETAKIVAAHRQGFDIIIGSRADRQGAPFYRQILTYGMIILRTLLLNMPFKDTQCGFKAFSAPAAKRIFGLMLQLHPPVVISGPAVNPGFDIELLYLGRRLGYKIAQIPVAWTYKSSARVSLVKDAVNGLRDLLLVRWRALTGAYHV